MLIDLCRFAVRFMLLLPLALQSVNAAAAARDQSNDTHLYKVLAYSTSLSIKRLQPLYFFYDCMHALIIPLSAIFPVSLLRESWFVCVSECVGKFRFTQNCAAILFFFFLQPLTNSNGFWFSLNRPPKSPKPIDGQFRFVYFCFLHALFW